MRWLQVLNTGLAAAAVIMLGMKLRSKSR